MKKFLEVRGKVNLVLSIIMLLFISISYVQARESDFLQEKVDRVCLENRCKKVVLDTRKHEAHALLNSKNCRRQIVMSNEFFQDEVFFSKDKDFYANSETNGDLYIGPDPDTFLIDSNYVQDGNIIIFGQGILVVDNAQVNLSGHLYAQNRGQAILRNNAHLHFNQFYVGQYFVWLVDSASFEATDAIVDANGVMHYAQLHDNSTYIAIRTAFPDWTFRKVFDRSTLILKDVYHVGDIMVDDSCFVHFTRCDTLMPWLETPDGSVISMEFPDPDAVDHFEFSDAVPGVDGIGYTFIVDTCWRCWWSLETWPGCSVTVTNSEIRGSCLRIPGSDTFDIYGITNYHYHTDLLVPLSDRHLEYINTYVYWWNWYPMESTVFNIDSCVFGEMIGRGNSETYATRCTHDGATITLNATDSAFVSFTEGISLAFVSSFKRATLLLANTRVTPTWPYQSTNLAHGNSYFLAVNSYFEYEPEAMDTSLVIVAAIDSPATGMIDTSIDIYGSAWIDAGTFNQISFDRYKLSWSYDGGTIWTLIQESTTQVHSDIIGVWNTSGMSIGEYDFRLTTWDDVGDSLTAFGDITLYSSGIEEDRSSELRFEGVRLFQNYPNPFTQKTEIRFQISDIRHKTKNQKESVVSLKIYNVSGSLVKSFSHFTPHSSLIKGVSWDGKNDSGEKVSSGIYFCKLKVANFETMKKLILIR